MDLRQASADLHDFVSLVLRDLTFDRDLSLASALTLATLERGGPMRISTLAVHEGIAQPSMTQLIQRLEARGLAERHPDPADARATLASISPGGRRALAERRAVSAERLAELVAHLPAAEATALAGAIAAVLPAMREQAADRLVPA